MTAEIEILQRELSGDLLDARERVADEKFCGELYRALTRNRLRKPQVAQGHVTLSFGQAEAFVNDLRAAEGYEPLTLAQTGDEGEVDSTVQDVLEPKGWHIDPASTGGGHDPLHDRGDASPPSEDAGRHPDSGRWAQDAHAEAERERRRKMP